MALGEYKLFNCDGIAHSMIIREATVGDTKAVLGLLDQLCSWDECSSYGQDAFISALSDPSVTVFVAEDGGVVVGEATVLEVPALRYRSTRVIVDEFIVDAKHRGKGIGTALLEHVVSYARNRGAHSVWVASRTDRKDAHELYKTAGFKMWEYSFRLDL